MFIKSCILLGSSILSISFANAQLSLEQNKSFAQLESENNNVLNSPKIEKIRSQIVVNANIVATGMICEFPHVETESLHNFFLMQFAKYEISKEEQEAIIIIHRNAVTDFINKNKGKIPAEKCGHFKNEFKKIYDYAAESVNK